VNNSDRDEVRIVNPRARATRARQQPQEGRQDGSFLGKQAYGAPEFSDVLECIAQGHSESIGVHWPGRHGEVLPNHLGREYQRAPRLDQGRGVRVKGAAGVGRLDQDVGVDQQRLSDRRPRK
jgi:hypothetical protein